MKPVSNRDAILVVIFLASASILLYSGIEALVYGTVATKALWAFAASAIAFDAARRLWDVPGVRWSWAGMGLGMGVLAVGEACFSYHQLVRGIELPFPSVADVFFVLAYPILILALVGFVLSYRGVLPAVGGRELAATAGGTLAVLLVLALFATRWVVAQDAPLVEKALTASYVWLDIGLVLPLVLLARVAFALRGGGLGWAWGFLLSGFVAMEAADLLFGFTPWLAASPYPYLDEVFYVASYLLILEGMLVHRRALA